MSRNVVYGVVLWYTWVYKMFQLALRSLEFQEEHNSCTCGNIHSNGEKICCEIWNVHTFISGVVYNISLLIFCFLGIAFNWMSLLVLVNKEHKLAIFTYLTGMKQKICFIKFWRWIFSLHFHGFAVYDNIVYFSYSGAIFEKCYAI